MKVTDYIVEFLIKQGVTDIFGYPGGVICHLIDSARKYTDKISIHSNYNEQASSFSACGFAQESHNVGVAFSTSGPGATNLVTGIANAFYDSTPTVFFTGQVDTYGLKYDLPIRQRGFQETDIVSIVKSITKYAVRVDDPLKIKYELEKSFYLAKSGNPGPVLLDLPADVQRAEIEENKLEGYLNIESNDCNDCDIKILLEMLKISNRPCLLIGNGVKQSGATRAIRDLIRKLRIPSVFSMPAFDVLPFNDKYNFGFIGANGHRYANFVVGKSDLIVSIGSRMDLKQVGFDRAKFAPQANIVRIDIDRGTLSHKVHDNEMIICADLTEFVPKMISSLTECDLEKNKWVKVCSKIRTLLRGYDSEKYHELIGAFSEWLPDNTILTLDVGQSQVWCCQYFKIKNNQKVHMSAGLGSMGYSLPAAIGAYFAGRKIVFSFNGDGGIQMNLQELQFLCRDKIPIHVVIINNHSLGMIRSFQEANFEKNYTLTVESRGYSVPDFSKLAHCYGLQYFMIEKKDDLKSIVIDFNKPSIIEIKIPDITNLNPNFGRSGFIQDQRPNLSRELYDKLMQL